MKFLQFLEGKKTFILAGIGGIVTALLYAGVITQEQATPILTMLGLGTAATVRAAIK